ncbi:hypothetical protein ACJX0J_026503, partial [Zea mays]
RKNVPTSLPLHVHISHIYVGGSKQFLDYQRTSEYHMIAMDMSREVIPGDHLNLETCELQKYNLLNLVQK